MTLTFTAVAILITAAWLGLIGYYIYLSQQQEHLEKELEQLRRQLAEQERDRP